jgi:hypothetical protein
VSALWFISALCIFAIGLSVGQRSMLSIAKTNLANTQAELLFNRVEDERHLSNLLKRGCVGPAAAFVAYVTDADMRLMHGFILGKKMDEALSYIRDRDPEVLKEAARYSPRFPNPWEEPTCD